MNKKKLTLEQILVNKTYLFFSPPGRWVLICRWIFRNLVRKQRKKNILDK